MRICSTLKEITALGSLQRQPFYIHSSQLEGSLLRSTYIATSPPSKATERASERRGNRASERATLRWDVIILHRCNNITSTAQKSSRKVHHHGEAVRLIPLHGYVIFCRPLAGTYSWWTGQGHCRRILFYYVKRLRKKLISTLIYFNFIF